MIKRIAVLLLLLPGIKGFSQEFTTHIFKEADNIKLSLDVLAPSKESSGKGKSPVIIMFHGGGLVGGDRNQMHQQCQFFSDRGFVTVSADYRLLKKGAADPEADVPNCIRDAKSAIRWVKQHAADFNIDTTKVILGGGSAGGFLATEATLNNDINEATDNLAISTKALLLILYNPAYIPVKRYGPDVVPYVSSKTPPAIMFFGDQDHYKPGGDAFYKALANARVKTELWVAKGETHSFFNKKKWQEPTNRKAYNFLISSGLAKGTAMPDMADAPLMLQDPQTGVFK